ncbi:MAG: cob(I)yrinic acid a,c-diamide adenosyltransferase [Phycisphaerae bacterium]
MRLYTKSGDTGETGLIDGSRVPKDHRRVVACGELDELNAALGMVMSVCGETAWRAQMAKIQDRLFVLGAELANPGRDPAAPAIGDGDVKLLEQWIDAATDAVEPLKEFIFPGGSELAARLHLARTVCRRAERNVVSLARAESIAGGVITYVNRLADLLFAWARLANKRAGVEDLIWTAPDTS